MPPLVVLDEAALDFELKDPDGTVGRYISSRATVVQIAAKVQIGRGNGGWSSVGNRTMRLNMAQVKRPELVDGEFAVRVGSDTVFYAGWVHTGRGPVVAKKKVLRFQARGVTIFAKRVKAAKANRYLTDNLALAVEM